MPMEMPPSSFIEVFETNVLFYSPRDCDSYLKRLRLEHYIKWLIILCAKFLEIGILKKLFSEVEDG
jgi:hypothetical protein